MNILFYSYNATEGVDFRFPLGTNNNKLATGYERDIIEV